MEYMLELLKKALIEVKETTQNVGETEELVVSLLQDNLKLSSAKAAEKTRIPRLRGERIMKS